MALNLTVRMFKNRLSRMLSPDDGPIHIINNDTNEEGTVSILSVDGNKVKVSIDLPDNYTILRDKLYQEQRNGD